MNLSIITVTHNSEKTIEEYLASLAKYLPSDSEVIIIDNNSSDKTVELLHSYQQKKLIKDLKIIFSKTNDGFSVGCNRGADLAKGNYLLFLNPDTKILDGALNKLIDYANQLKSFGIIAPILLNSSGVVQSSVRNLPSLKGAFLEYVLNKKNSFEEYAPSSNKPTEVGAVYGAAIFIKREIYDKVNGFDNKYFLYYEDLDLCRKIHELGLKIIYYPMAQIYHQVGVSAKSLKLEHLLFGLRTLAYFVPMKNSGAIYYQVKSGNIYHGFVIAFLIRLLSFIFAKV